MYPASRPKVSWDRLQPHCDPDGDKRLQKINEWTFLICRNTKLPVETLIVKCAFCFFLPVYIHTEAAVAGRWTECIDEEGAGHLLALLSDQPINRHSTAHLRCTQAICTKGQAKLHVHI